MDVNVSDTKMVHEGSFSLSTALLNFSYMQTLKLLPASAHFKLFYYQIHHVFFLCRFL